MKTEDVPLDIKDIFEKKKLEYNPCDVARMRYLCRQFVEFILEMQKNGKTSDQRDLSMENRSEGTETIRVR